MEDANAIKKATERFLERIQEAEIPDLAVTIDDDVSSKTETPVIKLVLLGIEEAPQRNRFEKIRLKKEDEKGNVYEYLTDPPTMLNLKYMVVPYHKSKVEVHRILGMLIKHLADNDMIKSDDFNWLDNNNTPVRIEKETGLPLEKQINLFNSLGMEYSPSLFFQLTVGIDSGKESNVTLVKERTFVTFDKNKRDQAESQGK